MTIQIPQGAKTMQLFDMNIDIPEGKTYIDIDDNFLQNKYNQFMQNNQQQNNFNSQEELALDGKPMSMYQAPQVSQNEPQEQGVWSKINKGLEDFNNLIDPKRMISEGLDYLSPKVTSGEEGARQKIEDATNQISGGLLARNFTSLDNEEQKQIFQIAYDEIKKLGYEPFLEINNGDYKYIGVDKNGKEVDFTPSFRNTLASTKNELAFSVAGGYAGSLAKTAGQTIAKKALNYFAPSAIGAGSGAVSDLHSQSNNTGIEASYMDYAKRFGSAAAEDALAGAVVGSAIKGIGKTYKSVGDLISSVKTGAQAGKDMIDGMAVKGGNLGNRVIDKITQKDIPMIGKFTDGGLQNAETIFNNLTKNVENKKQIDELIAKENPTYLENGKPTIEILKNIVEQGLNKNNPQFIQDSAKRTSAILKNISNTLQGVPTTQRREILLKSAQAYPEIGSFLDDVLKADKDASISFLNIIKEQDEVFKNKIGLNGEFDYKAWQKDNHAYENRINQEYGSAISKLDELNNGNIVLTSEDLAKLENFKNNNFLEQDVKNNIQSYLNEIKGKEVSAEQIFGLRTAINKQLNTGNKTYNTKQAYGIVKEILDDALIRNASNKVLAKEILDNANKNFALKENFKESYLGMMKPQETKEGLTDRLVKGLRNINEDKNLENAFKGMNEQERLANETHVMNSLLEKHRIEGVGYDFKSLAKDLEDVNFSSKKIKDAKDVINTYALIYNNNRDLIMTALASSGKKTNSSIATTIHGVFDRILISGIFARLHALAPFMKSAKEQALRNQILDAIKLAKTNKEVISNLKNIKIADQEQSRIFKDALDNYIKVDKEQNKILKDALIKEGVIKGDNFFMDKADPKDNSLRFIGKNGKEYTINKDVRNEWMKTFNLKNIDDEYIPNIPKEAKIALKDREIKLTKGSLLKLIEKDRIKYIPHIKETLESPQVILKDKDDFIFIKNIDNQTYFTSIGKDYETHLTIISNSPKKQNNIRNKIKNAEVVYYNNARALPTSRASSETNQVSFSDKHSTQAKHKESLEKYNRNFYLKHYKDFIDKSENKKIFFKYNFGDFLDIKKLEKSLEKYKESKPQEIKYKELKRGYILDDLLNVDEDVSYAVVNKDDLKPSLTRSLSQFRNKHSNSTISDIRNSFNEREHFKESSNFDGIPTITKDGLVIAGNHRTTAIRDLKGENLARYIKQAKRVYGEDVFKGFDENKAMIVRILDKNDDDTIIRLSKLSNDGRLSDESEKLQALGAKYKEKLLKIENSKINTEKELMNFLGSRDILESKRALLDHLMPNINDALLSWERRSGGDTEFSKILNDNALNLLHLKQALNKNKVFKDNGNSFFSLFKRAIESINQSNVYKNNNELYDIIKKYTEPSLNFEKEFISSNKDLQADILGFIIKYNDTLTNPSEAFGNKIKKAIEFIYDNDSFSLFNNIKLSNYDVLNQMLNINITNSIKYQELLNKAIDNLSDEKNIIKKLNENIKNKKSVKQRLDEKIQDDKKAREDILKRYDNFLKENKDNKLDFLDKMNLNTIEYNLTRQMIVNAKESTNKGVKKDIPSDLRGKIEKELNIQPLKEFGENYAEYYHDGKGALQKLLIEKQGQVAGAFHRKDLGDIDLVWGEVIDKIKHKGYGLAHIIDKHPELDLKLISDIVDKGKLNNQNNIRYRIEYKNYIIGLSSEYKGNKRTFIITAFERYKG
ncbi:hypothetical protein I8B02_000373 [Campylobacter jejuni]|nr:hypothetical protein [Campylobacter jejuni]EAI9137048.1 hypothetical protein [Campylobacter jejuni]EAJ9985809.1 hypothetical protein [Campylobacter jejuni]EGB0588087.1 hypothetical protein [Campylobacter jejuni]EGR7884728.1 hypothetical protein [Campylobacter jejuni]